MSTFIRRGFRVLLLLLPVVLAGCARTSTAPVGADTIEITVHVGTICDGGDAERLARRHAAVETIRRGFDDYIVIGSVGGDHMAEEEPATARTSQPSPWSSAGSQPASTSGSRAIRPAWPACAESAW